MQMFGLHKSIYKLKKTILPEEKIDPALVELKKKLKNWENLKKRKVPDKEISEIVSAKIAIWE